MQQTAEALIGSQRIERRLDCNLGHRDLAFCVGAFE
jgi:hypothetical protein